MKKITIANAHSDHKPMEKIVLELQGGSPYFVYVWIDDVLYVLHAGTKTVTLKKLK